MRDSFERYAIGTVKNVTEDIRVISGDEQGWYAWLAVNFLTGKFGTVSLLIQHLFFFQSASLKIFSVLIAIKLSLPG